MSKPSQPAQPDPVQVAQAQQATNVGTAVAQSTLNNTNLVGPGGTTSYAQTGGYTDPDTGQWVPQWTQTTELSPLGNQLLQGQQDLTNSYMPVIQQAAAGIAPLDISGGASGDIVAQGPQAFDRNVTNAVYNQQASFLDPQWNQQATDLQDQLSRQGIPVGSDAWNAAMTNFNNAKTQAYNAAGTSAISQGANIAGQNFGLALQGQNQNVALQQAAQANPIGLLSLLTAGAGLGGAT